MMMRLSSSRSARSGRRNSNPHHHGVAPGQLQPVGDSLEVGDRLRLERAVDQLFHDDAIEFVALAEIGTQELQSARRQPLRVDFAVDELSCSRHPVENI